MSSNFRARVQSRISTFKSSDLNHWTARPPHCVGLGNLLKWNKEIHSLCLSLANVSLGPLSCFLLNEREKGNSICWFWDCFSREGECSGVCFTLLTSEYKAQTECFRLSAKHKFVFNSPYGSCGYVIEVKGMPLIFPELLSPKLATSFQLLSLTLETAPLEQKWLPMLLITLASLWVSPV